ncbi:hypothetical protein [Paucibacter sp. M5-1]|uniref:hypothetical protein n=1 Tax=Paucibacter sp. M5-1 TaxID=3015998 RepID=UPI0022B93D4B|nr:hypothetical protein [Paucibacter sp. M5-1]MCZ7884103.1 hypothetical protein [Paucibacter sp. M5-1]
MAVEAGKGNLAMCEGAELGQALCGDPSDMETVLAGYELPFFTRRASFAEQTARNHRRFFGDEAPHSVVPLFTAHWSRLAPQSRQPEYRVHPEEGALLSPRLL